MVVIYCEVQRTFDIKHNNLWVIVHSTKTRLQTATSYCATNSGHGIVYATGLLDKRCLCPYCIFQLGSSVERVHLPFYPFHYALILVLYLSTGSSRKNSREGRLAWCRTVIPQLYLYTWGLQWARQPWEFLCVLLAPFLLWLRLGRYILVSLDSFGTHHGSSHPFHSHSMLVLQTLVS